MEIVLMEMVEPVLLYVPPEVTIAQLAFAGVKLPEVTIEVCAQASEVINTAIDWDEDPLTAKQAAVLQNCIYYTLVDITMSARLALEAATHE
jgi:hypothetical protein